MVLHIKFMKINGISILTHLKSIKNSILDKQYENAKEIMVRLINNNVIQILMIYWKLNFLTITFIQITLFIV